MVLQLISGDPDVMETGGRVNAVLPAETPQPPSPCDSPDFGAHRSAVADNKVTLTLTGCTDVCELKTIAAQRVKISINWSRKVPENQ